MPGGQEFHFSTWQSVIYQEITFPGAHLLRAWKDIHNMNKWKLWISWAVNFSPFSLPNYHWLIQCGKSPPFVPRLVCWWVMLASVLLKVQGKRDSQEPAPALSLSLCLQQVPVLDAHQEVQPCSWVIPGPEWVSESSSVSVSPAQHQVTRPSSLTRGSASIVLIGFLPCSQAQGPCGSAVSTFLSGSLH